MEKRKDIFWVTLAKFLGLYLMILGHMKLLDENSTMFVFSFHMPLFFILSGMFSKNRTFSDTLRNVWQKLLYPFVIMTLLVISVQTILWIKNRYAFTDLVPYIVGSFVSPGKSFSEFSPLCIFLWFLLALAEVKLIANQLKRPWHWILAISICIMAALALDKFSQPLPFAFDSVVLSLPFYGIGKFTRNVFLKDLDTRSNVFLAIVFGVFITFLFQHNGKVDINNGTWGNNLILFFLNGFIGTAFIVYTAKSLSTLSHLMGGVKMLTYKFITKWVAGSILVIAFSARITGIVKGILPSLCNSNMGGIIIGIIVVILMFPLILFFQKFFPKALGNR